MSYSRPGFDAARLRTGRFVYCTTLDGGDTGTATISVEPSRRAPSRSRLRPGAAMLARNRRKLPPGRVALDRHRPLIVSGSRASPPPIYM